MILPCPSSIPTCKIGYKSSPLLLICGIPQGSVLGPILFILYAKPLSDVISHHSLSHHMFVEDTELYKSHSSSEAFILSRTTEACISDVQVWVVQNKLQLNDDKTEILLICSAPGIDLPFSVLVGQCDILFSRAARNLGVIFDSELALKEQVNKHFNWLIWILGGSVQSDSIFQWKLLKLSFPLLFSLGLIIAMLSFLALLGFFLIKSRE